MILDVQTLPDTRPARNAATGGRTSRTVSTTRLATHPSPAPDSSWDLRAGGVGYGKAVHSQTWDCHLLLLLRCSVVHRPRRASGQLWHQHQSSATPRQRTIKSPCLAQIPTHPVVSGHPPLPLHDLTSRIILCLIWTPRACRLRYHCRARSLD